MKHRRTPTEHQERNDYQSDPTTISITMPRTASTSGILLPKMDARCCSGGAATTLMKAVGGPYDGVTINVPPGGTSVAMPSAFGSGDLRGSSIYERYITDEGVTVMLYVGQGEGKDDDEYTPKLILP